MVESVKYLNKQARYCGVFSAPPPLCLRCPLKRIHNMEEELNKQTLKFILDKLEELSKLIQELIDSPKK